MTPLDDLAAQVRAGFSGDGPVALVAAPGRVNLIGDHTDYSEGFVLPAAIDRECVVGWRATTSGHLTMRSQQFDGLVDISSSGRVSAASVEPSWGRFAAGVVAALADRGGSLPGADLVISSNVPAGSGLSSSSALTVALTLALGDAAGFVLDRRELARIALDAEVTRDGRARWAHGPAGVAVR